MELNKCIDGINCINVYSKGLTPIGTFYSNFFYSPFTCDDGEFKSIEAYWYWIRTGGKSPKDTYGYNAKKIGKTYPIVCDINEEKVKKAIDIKLKNNIRRIITHDDFTLPLVHYYDYDGKRVDGGHKWLIEHIELRREQLKKYLEEKRKK